MATIKVWFHQAATIDSNGMSIPVLSEPSLNADDAAESVVLPGVTSAAPVATEFAVIETDKDIRYTVRKEGQTSPNASADTKILYKGRDQIALRPKQTIHFVEA